MSAKADLIKKRKADLMRDRAALVKETRGSKAIGQSISGGTGITVPALCLSSRRIDYDGLDKKGNKKFSTAVTFQVYGSFKGYEFDEDWAEKLSDTEIRMNVRQKIKAGVMGGDKAVYETKSSESLKIGDEIQASMYGKVPTAKDGRTLREGDFVLITGIKKVYDEQKDRIYVNCENMIHAPELGTYMDVLRIIEAIPVDKVDIREVTMPFPAPDKDSREGWTEEQWEALKYVNQNMFLPVRASDESVHDADSGQAFDTPLYPDDNDTWSYKNRETGVVGKKVRALIPVTQWDHEKGTKVFCLLQVVILDTAVNEFGIVNPDEWESLAKHHIPYMRFGIRAFIGHKNTDKDQINSQANDTPYNFTICLVATQVFADLGAHLRDNCLPVTYEKVVKDLGESVNSKYSEHNDLGRRTNNDILNLQEWAGSLTSLRDRYDFYAMVNKKMSKNNRKTLAKWGDRASQAEHCATELDQDTEELDLPDTLIVVYFAVKREDEEMASASNGNDKKRASPPADSEKDEDEPKAKKARSSKK